MKSRHIKFCKQNTAMLIVQLFIFSARHQLDTWGVEGSRSELKSECADILHQNFLVVTHTDEPQRERNSCLWLQSRSVLSSFGVVLMSCRVHFHVVRSALQNLICLLFIFADQVFIDPTFSGIFVCGPLQSFVVNVCTSVLTTVL